MDCFTIISVIRFLILVNKQLEKVMKITKIFMLLAQNIQRTSIQSFKILINIDEDDGLCTTFS